MNKFIEKFKEWFRAWLTSFKNFIIGIIIMGSIGLVFYYFAYHNPFYEEPESKKMVRELVISAENMCKELGFNQDTSENSLKFSDCLKSEIKKITNTAEEQDKVSNDEADAILTSFKIEDLEEIKNINHCNFEEGLEWYSAQNTPEELAKSIENTTKKELRCFFYMGRNSKEQSIISEGVIDIESLRKIHKKLKE